MTDFLLFGGGVFCGMLVGFSLCALLAANGRDYE